MIFAGFSPRGENPFRGQVIMDKVYFWDLGVRNALIGNLKPLGLRDDAGRLWENFMIAERCKLLEYQGGLANTYFWRTHTGAEIDLIEERDGQLYGFEYKWGAGKARVPKTFLETYPNASFAVVQQDQAIAHASAV